jgi:mRNA interferase RelE/StbE
LAWLIKIQDAAEKDIGKLDRVVAKRIISFLRDRLAPLDDPRSIGEALKGTRLGEYWKYRIGDYRIISRIEDNQITVYVIRVGNRREIYR